MNISLFNILFLVIILLFSVNINSKISVKQSKYFMFLKKKIKCKSVLYRMLNRKPANKWPPPRIPPSNLYKKFTQNGEMPIKSILYFSQKYSGSTAMCNNWNKSFITELSNNHIKHKQISGYSIVEENLIDEAISKYNINGKDVAVIGSENPWVEAIILTKNPKSITTIEYGKINSTIPLLKTFTPHEYAKHLLQSNEKFDFVVSYSSMEHSGLGRYGDELEPDGDIHAAEEVWCMLKKGGYFLIGLPYRNKSYIRWNADRNYGPERMKYFAANFEQVEFFGKPWKGQHPLLLRKS